MAKTKLTPGPGSIVLMHLAAGREIQTFPAIVIRVTDPEAEVVDLEVFGGRKHLVEGVHPVHCEEDQAKIKALCTDAKAGLDEVMYRRLSLQQRWAWPAQTTKEG